MEEPQVFGTPQGISKVPTGIQGLDELTGGGIPRGRSTVVIGTAGSGKTVFAMQYIVKGALESAEPGVFVSFDESADKLSENFVSIGWDLKRMQEEGLVAIDTILFDPTDLMRAGALDLKALFLRIMHMTDTLGAKRLAIDTVQRLAVAFRSSAEYRHEISGLFRWLGEQGLTTVITAESGSDDERMPSIEEFASDCVVALSHRVESQRSTRRMRIVKYRGSLASGDEHPFLIDSDGLTVMPVTSLKLDYSADTERMSTGLERLDELLGGGFFRGSTVLISGGPGTGKSSLAGTFIEAAAVRGERSTLISYEESPSQIVRNLRSCGIDLAPHMSSGLVAIRSLRPTTLGIEPHLKELLDTVYATHADNMLVDPISSLLAAGEPANMKALIVRVIDAMKQLGKTVILTSLIGTEPTGISHTDAEISSLADTWLALSNNIADGTRVRTLDIVKSRGTSHDPAVREFHISDEGFQFG